MDNVSEKIKELRKGVGLSQEDFAVKIGVSRQTVIKWENGTVHPSAQYALKICEEFALSPKAFWEEESDVLVLLDEAEAQAIINKKNQKAFSVKQFIANVLLVLAFLYLSVLIVTAAISLITLFAPFDSDSSVITVIFNTSPQAVAFYAIGGVLACVSLFIIIKYFVVKSKKKRKLI